MNLYQNQLGLYGAAGAIYASRSGGGHKLKRAGGLDDLTVNQPYKQSRWKTAGKGLGGAFNVFGFGSNMGSLDGVGLKKGFDKQIKGRYFNYGKAVGKYMWIIAAIDLILMFVPGVRIVDAMVQLGVNMPASITEAAMKLGNEEITKYTDWAVALQHMFGQIEYEKWQKEMEEKGKSRMSLAVSDTKRGYEVDRNKLSAEKLLTEDIRKDYKDGKISKQMYDVMLKFSKGQGRMEDVMKLNPEEKKKLLEEYAMEKDYSWILKDLKQTLEQDVKKSRETGADFVDDQLEEKAMPSDQINWWNPVQVIARAGLDLFHRPDGDQVESYLLSDIKYADKIFKAGEMSIGYETVYLTAKEKFILYKLLHGDPSYLEDAPESTKKKFAEAGISTSKESSDGVTMFQPGPASALFAKDQIEKENKNFKNVQLKLKQYMATSGFSTDLDRQKELEKNILGYGEVNTGEFKKKQKMWEKFEAERNKIDEEKQKELEKNLPVKANAEIEKKEVKQETIVKDPEPVKLSFGYRVVNSGWNWGFGTFHDLESDDKITKDTQGYLGAKIKWVYNPADGKRYYLKQEIEAHEFFANPMAFQKYMPAGVYVNKNGSIFFGNPNPTEATDTAKEVIKDHDERQDIQKKALDFYKRNKVQEDSKAVYTPKTGVSVAGGANLNTQYVKAGKASIAGGNRMKK